MGRPVVVSSAVAQGIEAAPLSEFEVAGDAREFARKGVALMNPAAGEEMGKRARRRVFNSFNWDARLARFGELLESAPHARLSQVG